jgi:cbb3-type cytochrome oxidase subunit 1
MLLTLKDAATLSGRKVVVVFSNGPDNASMVAPEDVREFAQSEGISIYMVSMWIAGVVQGLQWLQGDIPFMETVKAMHPYFVARMLGGAMVVAGQVLLAYNVWQTSRGAVHARQQVTALAPQEAI